MKTCTQCGLTKPFAGYSMSSDGKRLRAACRTCAAAATARWVVENPGKHRAVSQFRERNPSPERRRKSAVRRTARNAVQSGRLVRMPCEVCGVADVHAHHDDYSKPLSVRWLCKPHHDEHHRTLAAACTTHPL